METDDTTNLVEGTDTAEATAASDTGVEAQEIEPQYDDDGNLIEAVDEDEEIDLDDDLKLKVSKAAAAKLKELKEGNLRQADYTRKTQEIAELKRATGETLQQLHNMNAQEFGARSALMSIDSQLAKYQGVNFAAALAEANRNFDEDAKANINAAFMEYQQLGQARQNALNQIGQAQHARQSFEQQETAKLIDQGRTELKKHVPEWNDGLKAKLVEFAAGFGGQDATSKPMSPHSRTRQSHQKAVQAVKPAAKVGGGSPPATFIGMPNTSINRQYDDSFAKSARRSATA
jgi:hypothetical protein